MRRWQTLLILTAKEGERERNMRRGRGILLFGVLLILFFIIAIRFINKIGIEEYADDKEVVKIDMTKVESDNAGKIVYFGRIENASDVLNDSGIKIYPAKYNFSLLYAILYDNPADIETEKEAWKNRLGWFQKVMHRESLGKISPDAKLVFLNVNKLGDKKLDYSKRTYLEWYKALDEYLKEKYDYNILGFSPARIVEWCNDAKSVGHNINDKIMFCMDYLSDDQNAVMGIIHRILHGLGDNHVSNENKQLIFLDWFSGLPQTKYLSHTIVDQTEGLFFNKHFLKVIGILPLSKFEEKCLDSQSLVCFTKNDGGCKTAYGPFCLDNDKDGILDSLDDYVFSSPVSGKDSDDDGIIDRLDLCNWNKINILGDLRVGKMKLVANKTTDIIFKGENGLEVSKIRVTKYDLVSGEVIFPDRNLQIIEGNKLRFDLSGGIWRLQVFYNRNGSEFYRPYFLYALMDANYIIEKEWYYFNRFGCDVPANLDLSDYKNYDSNLDGLPDGDKFTFASKINEDYDWDGDSIPDIDDTLPTITGNCSNEFVKGVLDSDSDGLCDPGYFNYGEEGTLKYGDLVRRVGKNPLYDQCPYFAGTAENKGCPDLDKDNLLWYSDPCPLDKNNDCNTYDVEVVIE